VLLKQMSKNVEMALEIGNGERLEELWYGLGKA
jgi:hypothetical protein